MAKRFTDTDKWKKGFIRALPSPYKIFWFYLLDDCNNAGVWDVDMEVVCLRTGEEIDQKKALKFFNKDEKRIHVFDNGKKWFIPPFITFQYGEDFVLKTSKNRLIKRVHDDLARLKLLNLIPVRYPLNSLHDGEQEKDKDMDMDKKGCGGLSTGKGRRWVCYVDGCRKDMPEKEMSAHLAEHKKNRDGGVE